MRLEAAPKHGQKHCFKEKVEGKIRLEAAQKHGPNLARSHFAKNLACQKCSLRGQFYLKSFIFGPNLASCTFGNRLHQKKCQKRCFNIRRDI